MSLGISVSGLDHLLLTCADVEVTLTWYVEALGLEPVRVDEWRAGEVPFPSVRLNADTILDFIGGSPYSGRLDHLCLVVEPLDLAAVAASGDFDVINGPAPRWGARGTGTSLFVRDPDGTVVELRHY